MCRASTSEDIPALPTAPIPHSPPRSIGHCPICQRPAVPATRPFCGPRCAEVDLGRWLTGQYVVPGPPADLGEDALPAPDSSA